MYIISGIYHRRKIAIPKGNETRPTTSSLREAVFNICQSSIQGARFLDLFAGTGAMGLEALSREAKSAVFVDQSRNAIQCIKENIAKFKVENSTTVYCGDVIKTLKRLIATHQQFDIIYIDPPYEFRGERENHLDKDAYIKEIVNLIDQNNVLADSGYVFIEERAKESQSALSEFTWKSLIFQNKRRVGAASLEFFRKG